MRLERVWGILQSPVTSKLDWVIKYTGPQGSGLFEPVLQAYEQAAAAVLERERYHNHTDSSLHAHSTPNARQISNFVKQHMHDRV